MLHTHEHQNIRDEMTCVGIRMADELRARSAGPGATLFAYAGSFPRIDTVPFGVIAHCDSPDQVAVALEAASGTFTPQAISRVKRHRHFGGLLVFIDDTSLASLAPEFSARGTLMVIAYPDVPPFAIVVSTEEGPTIGVRAIPGAENLSRAVERLSRSIQDALTRGGGTQVIRWREDA